MRAFRVAYDGRPYNGFQRQPDVPTVADTILDALRDLGALDADTDVPEGYAASGRTDAGVSALAQTVAFECPEWLTAAAFNSALPASIRAWASADVALEFHATHDAAAREYTYFLFAPAGDSQAEAATNGTVLDRARSACSWLSGEHDFHNLTPDDTGTIRDVDLSVARDDAFLVLTVRAGGFARQLVRRLVSVVDEIATGTAGTDRIERVLADEPLPGPDGVAPAPPYPLVLTDVVYPGVSFQVDAEAAESAQDVFDARAREWAARARVGELLRDGVAERG